MTAVAQGVTAGAAATAEQHRGGLLQSQLVGDTATAEVGAITEPAVAAAATATELVHPCRQIQSLGAASGGTGIDPSCWTG